MAIMKRSTCDTKVSVLNVDFKCPKCGAVKTAIDSSRIVKCETCKCSMIKDTPKCDCKSGCCNI